MLLQDVRLQNRGVGPKLPGSIGHLRNRLERNCVVQRFIRIAAPGEGTVTCDKHGGHHAVIECGKPLDDHATRLEFIIRLHFLGRQNPRHGNVAVKMVRMGRSQAGNFAPCLREHRGIVTMGVCDPANRFKLAVEQYVRRRIAGGSQIALHDFSIQIHDNHVGRIEFVVGNTARLNDDQPLAAINSTNISPGQRDQPLGHQFAVGPTNLPLECLEHQRVSRRTRCRMAINSFITPNRLSRYSVVPNASCS